jgi:uncharacterized protein (DUF1697 family)
MPSKSPRGRLQTYVALLRGINLGARNKVSMTDLRALVAQLGGEDVTTHVQSGNVVFRSRGGAAELSRGIERAIGRELGLEIRVLVRTKTAIAKVVDANPFARGASVDALHVTFLAEKPARGRVRELEGLEFQPDRFRVLGQEVYLLCPNGYGKSKLSNAFFERRLEVAATTRNWKTVTKLAELAKA